MIINNVLKYNASTGTDDVPSEIIFLLFNVPTRNITIQFPTGTKKKKKKKIVIDSSIKPIDAFMITLRIIYF
jgi:hypothetical protein